MLALPGDLGRGLEVAHVLFEALISHLMRYVDLRLAGLQEVLLLDGLIRLMRHYSSLLVHTAGV